MAFKKKSITRKTARKKASVKKKQAEKPSSKKKPTQVKKRLSASKKSVPMKKQSGKADDRTLLLEIGTEEIPARFIPRALEEVKELFAKKLSEARLSHGSIQSHATPRRLAVIVDDVSDMQRDEVREVFGPPKSAAYDKEGNLTKAAIGFAKSQGVDPEGITVKDKESKGGYIVVTVEEKGLRAQEVLPGILKDVVLSLNFPKSMRWGDGTIRYARPIHWVLALYNGRTVEFDIEGIKSGNQTRGHRFLSPKEFKVPSPDKYVLLLDGKNVVVDVEKRKELISSQAAELAAGVKGRAVYDEDLLSILACITEYPVAVLAGFEEKYLELPDELLTSVMVGHQKYVPVSDESGKLINHFIVVSNTTAKNSETVRIGAERVIRARFDDAVFYLKEDRQKKLFDRLEALKKVTFQDKLGSLYDKTMRVKEVAGKVAGLLAPDSRESAMRAAELSKADLISGVVHEFPELQGIMGMYYARMDGEGDAVAKAIREQYLPSFSGDMVPETEAGTVVSLAEKLDNLASFFSIGLKPTGSEDPYALRRQALGVIAILEKKDVSLSALLDTVADEELKSDLVEFFEQRLEPMLLSRGYQHDVVQAQISNSTKLSISELYRRIDCLTSFGTNDRFNEFLMAIKRVRNISTGDALPEVDESLFCEEEERVLDSVVDSVSGDLKMFAQQCLCEKATDTLLRLTEPINNFFDNVLVMDKDEAVRNNRLALLNEIWQMVSSLADFSKLDERA